MGHFGRRPIRIDWFTLVAPALVLNYFGQGALLIYEPEAAVSPFFHLVPSWGLYPMVVLSTVAAVIASQAMISGAFSLTRQAVQLGYLPRMEIIHTSSAEIGQIYIPGVNWAMMAATIGLVLSFRTSTNLAGAYGIAVTGTMIITTLLSYFVTTRLWHWPRWLSILVTTCLLIADCSFFAANTVKIPDGGWFPLVAAVLVYILMSTWKKGRSILADRLREGSVPFETFVGSVRPESPTRVPGTAVFMARDAHGTPTALLHNLKHNKVLHSKVILLTVVTEEFPAVPAKERIEIQPMGKEFYRVIAHYGFTQDPGVPDVLEQMRRKGLDLDLMSTTFFLSRETLIPSKRPGMAIWREKLFALMSKNALRSTQFFQIPVNRVVELGMQVQL
jgi:KUP system potassium uptake protein